MKLENFSSVYNTPNGDQISTSVYLNNVDRKKTGREAFASWLFCYIATLESFYL